MHRTLLLAALSLACAHRAVAPPVPSLEHAWTVVPVGDMPVAPSPSATLEFHVSGGTATGFTGCNRFRAPFAVDELHGLKLGPILTTRRGCPPGMTDRAFLAALEQTTHYRLDDGALILLGAVGEELLRMRRAD